ncbi:MAG: FliA/WhiG family RNA polymerase sigma factor [Syntrophaceae bacterium]|nr:FliA/WhiG family RNA polymerase sigma factor [Syntrophaceae bacterium]
MNRTGKDEKILQYAPLVKQVVNRMTARLMLAPADRDALVQAGVIGLMAALEKFDETKNVRFETYAKIRIRGAVLDEMRAADRVPRSVRSKDTKIEKAFSVLQKRLGRPPVEEEMADHLGIPLEEYFDLLDEAKLIKVISTEDLPPDFLERYGCGRLQEEIDHGDPLSLLESEELKRGIKKAIDQLPEKERMVLALYYYEELNLKEIGRVLNLTESRICQIHTQAVLRLRGLMDGVR